MARKDLIKAIDAQAEALIEDQPTTVNDGQRFPLREVSTQLMAAPEAWLGVVGILEAKTHHVRRETETGRI